MKYYKILSLFILVSMAFIVVGGCTGSQNVNPSNAPSTSTVTTPTIVATPLSTSALDPLVGNWSANAHGVYKIFSFAPDGTWISYVNGSVKQQGPANKWSKIGVDKYSVVGQNSSAVITMNSDRTQCTVDKFPGDTFIKQ